MSKTNCPNCGAPLESGENNCIFCHTKVEQVQERSGNPVSMPDAMSIGKDYPIEIHGKKFMAYISHMETALFQPDGYRSSSGTLVRGTPKMTVKIEMIATEV